mmetsp:Transcript_19560/g.27448  ORF Transcript_19560/g.27448 Transcript_19560/m.27448 type:complete len:763 (+) Transcript_19560:22-2310(+)|eukprot:CAMPEP_0175099536 /NCGR_PEP_ID=MMETSP0086_2-20121207/6514_1 /TAXON_ID=136419 /ORGANISM="Unknown Unknown, Strain D1" /LENGTH=762 /DNA_ID=CAMNT_0016373403 /DNA_START=25 /DNA_END=2313 /DNA_ORIENTATION=+
MDTTADVEPQFELSCALTGHTFPVRDVACSSDDVIVTLEERGKARVFQRTGSNKFDCVGEHQVQDGMATVVESVSGTVLQLPQNTFISGGNDKVFKIWSPASLAGGGVDRALVGHTNVVNSVAVAADGMLLTGSWDGTVRGWDNNCTPVMELKGQHEHAVEVVVLQSGEVVTASASKAIVVYSPDGKTILKRITNAHDHVIRKLCVHPLGFASAGNDGFVKVWSNAGDPIFVIPAHVNSEIKFVYGVAVLPTGESVSCGEDGALRIFSPDGQTLVQTIQHSTAVRSVKVLPNGDLLTACSDKVARVFSRTPARHASESEKKDFADFASMASASNMQQLDTSTLPTEAALLQPGAQDGEMKVVNVTGRGSFAYKWSSAKMAWEELGEVMGQRKKPTLAGVEYDHVTDVYVTDDKKIQLGFNRDDDAEEVAARFTAMYGLPPDLRQQIIDHVRPLTDPAAAKLKKLNNAKLAEATALRHVPSWKTGGYEIVSSFKSGPFQKKVAELNTELQAAGSPAALSPPDLASLASLVALLDDKQRYHASRVSQAHVDVVKKLTQWPSDKLLPVLDVLRVLMCHPHGVEVLGAHATPVMLQSAQHGSTHCNLVLKGLANWVASRPKAAGERAKPPEIPTDILAFVTNSLDGLAGALGEQQPAGVHSAYVTLAYNLVVWLSKTGYPRSDLYFSISAGLTQALSAGKLPEKAVFFALLTLGTIGWSQAEARDTIKDSFSDVLAGAVRQAKRSSNPALQEVGEDVVRVFGLGGV